VALFRINAFKLKVSEALYLFVFSVHLESVILFKDAWTENQIIG